jgi:hypothetical protein
MENNKFNLKILEKIKSSHIKPKARWQFLLKNYLTWATSAVALIMSAASFSAMIYLLRFSDLALKNEIKKSSLEILLLTLPYFWIVFLIIFIFLIYYNIKKTKSGYRYPIWLVSLIALSTSIFLGSIFSVLGWGAKLDEKLSKNAPFYSEMINPHLEFWSNPSQGRLLGLVISPLSEDKSFQLLDKDQNVWSVQLQTVVGGGNHEFLINTGQSIRLLGKQAASEEFIAIRIMPLGSGRHFFERGHRKGEFLAPFGPGPGWRHQQDIK